VRSHQDYFGNAVDFFIVERAHTELTVRSTSTVSVQGRPRPGLCDDGAVGGSA
jgi:hypothetical protein